jgi:amino acid transporter
MKRSFGNAPENDGHHLGLIVGLIVGIGVTNGIERATSCEFMDYPEDIAQLGSESANKSRRTWLLLLAVLLSVAGFLICIALRRL